jgi:hypothetical protein
MQAAGNQQKLIQQQADSIAAEWKSQIVHIRYHVGEDHTGDPAVFFRVLLTDEASDGEKLFETASAVRAMIRERIDLRDLGLRFVYVNFRGQSEQTEMQSPLWA